MTASTLHSGERQVAPTRDGIRRDHLARYEWAAQSLRRDLVYGSSVVDVACGIGYGTQMLAQAGFDVLGLDRNADAISYAQQHYASPHATYAIDDAAKPVMIGDGDAYGAAVCFETIEHIKDPEPLLRALRTSSTGLLLASVPNETVFPWFNYAFHYRHYTKSEFEALLARTGWRVMEWWGQEGPESEVERDCDGRTLIAVAVPWHLDGSLFIKQPEVASLPKTEVLAGPKHVSIVGLGPSSAQYVSICKGLGGRRKFCDETWGINAFGDVLACDRIFHMDDVRVQEIRATAAPQSNIAGMLEWLKTHPGPIITSRAHPDYPGLVEFPLEDVVNECPNGYFNSTAAYAVAYAIWLGVEKISLFGCDFSYAKSHDAEKGRACVEFWLGIAAERGIKIIVPKTTSLLDACSSQADRFYGYDCVNLEITRQLEGRIGIAFTERDAYPTAEEIEARYDHSQPTVPEHLLAESAE